jgi:hypothetical protein
MILRRVLANGLWLAAGWNPEREIADEIARVYVMPETRSQSVWAGCEEGSHRCARRVGHDGSHRCECGTPWTNGNGSSSKAPGRRRWRDRTLVTTQASFEERLAAWARPANLWRLV